MKVSHPSWCLSHRFDPHGRVIADRHYNRRKVGSPQFVPPGRCFVLVSEDRQSLWVTSWPFAEFVRHAWPGAWINSCFRREGGERQASSLIREAIAMTRWKWPDVPELGIITFINTKKVQGTKTRSGVVYGYTYLKAGFRHVGETKGGLLAFQMLPEDMPEPLTPLPMAA